MMTEKITRRNFFRLFGGAVALATAPTTVIAKAIEIPVEFGWTWHVDRKNLDKSFSDLITKTLRDNAPKLRENISQNNALFLKLKDGRKAKLNIERISPDEQTKRMAERMKNRLPKPLEKYPETFGDINNLKPQNEFKGFWTVNSFKRLTP